MLKNYVVFLKPFDPASLYHLNPDFVTAYSKMFLGVRPTSSHNLLTERFFQYGLLGFISTIVFLLFFLRNIFLNPPTDSDGKELKSLALSCLGSLIVFYSFYAEPDVYIILIVLLNLSYIIRVSRLN